MPSSCSADGDERQLLALGGPRAGEGRQGDAPLLQRIQELGLLGRRGGHEAGGGGGSSLLGSGGGGLFRGGHYDLRLGSGEGGLVLVDLGLGLTGRESGGLVRERVFDRCSSAHGLRGVRTTQRCVRRVVQ